MTAWIAEIVDASRTSPLGELPLITESTDSAERRMKPVAVANRSTTGFEPMSTIPVQAFPISSPSLRRGTHYSEARSATKEIGRYLSHPKPGFQNSPSSRISFFHNGACFFNSEISHAHAEKPSSLWVEPTWMQTMASPGSTVPIR